MRPSASGKVFKILTMVYLALFMIVMLFIDLKHEPQPFGEWDDYSLPIASILNDHNFSINDSDIARHKSLFPEWSGFIDARELSGYEARDKSGELTWYFPLYSIVCMPLTSFLKVIGQPAVYAFSLTNIVLLITSIMVMNLFLKVDEKRKLLLTLLLTLNPIIFYIGWVSAEVFIYSMLIIGLTFWYNRSSKRAAIFVSLAGMLNPTIMFIGIVMIIEHLYELIKNRAKDQEWPLFIKNSFKDLIPYGCCFVPGLIPMIYNFYNVGHINLTSSSDQFVNPYESTFARFIAYFFDLNFGFLPYFPLILIMALVLIVLSVLRKNYRYFVWLLTFIVMVGLYSIMVHINCGMSGISRYNCWSITILIFAIVAVALDGLDTKKVMVNGGILAVGCVYTLAIVIWYGPFMAEKTNYTSFTPIAEMVLDKAPSLYNPLYSTFNNRTLHVDYVADRDSIKTPVAYYDNDGYVRKILASASDKDKILDTYFSLSGNEDAVTSRVTGLGEDLSYMTFSRKDKIIGCPTYEIGTVLSFSLENDNGTSYFLSGISSPEDWGTWTDGNEVLMRLRTDSSSDVLHMDIEASVYGSQDVRILVNNVEVTDIKAYDGQGISFAFDNPGEGVPIEIRMILEDARPLTESGINDSRALGLGLMRITVTE